MDALKLCLKLTVKVGIVMVILGIAKSIIIGSGDTLSLVQICCLFGLAVVGYGSIIGDIVGFITGEKQ